MLRKLSKVYTYEGKEYLELNLDLEDMTTEQYEQAEREFKALNPAFNGALESETGFIKLVLTKAGKLPHGFFDKLPAYEFVKLKYAVQTFLLTGSADLLTSLEPHV